MDRIAPLARSSEENGVKEPYTDIVSISSRNNTTPTYSKIWKPLALRPAVLVFTILLCWALIAVLQVFLTQSQRNGGVIFATKVSELPISHSFLYLYFPTVVAVIFSMYWAWIDLDAKRMEPYYQLSKREGALGKDSLLLQYPFDFLPLVPLKALRDRHWPVFWASFTVVLVTWGLVPTQAGIFSTTTTTRTHETSFVRSTAFISAAEQPTKLSYRYGQSTYAIATLNETLTEYMARNFTLAPFQPSSATSAFAEAHGNWTAETTLFSVQLNCEPAVQSITSQGTILANSTNGCSFDQGLNGNLTIGQKDSESGAFATKEFTAMFVGYQNPQGFADYSLDYRACPKESNHTFYAALQRNKVRDDAPANSVTAIYCWPTYYRQQVNATVDSRSLIPLAVQATGEKETIPDTFFNSTWFEAQMNGGTIGYEVRADLLPTSATPKYLETIAGTNISLTTGPSGGGFVQPMVGLSIAVTDRPLEELLDWQALAKSYADAYRLLFARAMRDVLHVQGTNESIIGQTQVRTEAVILEPVFVYIVEGLLGAVSLATMALLYLSFARTRNLRFDPSTIAGVMSMIADNEPLLQDFEDLDCCTAEAVHEIISKKRYKLVGDGAQVSIEQLRSAGDDDLEDLSGFGPARQNTLSKIAKPVRPTEFSFWVAGLVISLFIALAVGLIVLFTKARAEGLPLPSQNTIVQNVLENYIPTALATLIEPIWVLFNRILCLLQPIEQLQGCKAKAKDSIDLNYSSLPPQLVIFKALRSKHLVLAAVCAMALLANVLAIAFAGLFLQNTIDMEHAIVLHPPYQLKFVSINGSIGPVAYSTVGMAATSGAYQGGTGEDQFLIAESNYTSGTSLPTWTGDSMFFLPFLREQSNLTSSNQFEATTNALGARLECTSLSLDENFEATLAKPSKTQQAIRPQINITIHDGTTKVMCTNKDPDRMELRPGPIGNGCINGTIAAELIFQLSPVKANATLRETQACMSSVVLGWIRSDLGSCDVVPRTLSQQNSTFAHCQPKLTIGDATIRVDQEGRLQQKARDLTFKDVSVSSINTSTLYSNDPVNLISQSNKYLFPDGSPGWHNDSFAVDAVNYFMRRVSNSTKFLDPKQKVPTFEEIEAPLQQTYSYLFAIWLGVNKHKLLVPTANDQSTRLQGWRVQPERRLFLSTPMFAISLAILCIYAVVAAFVYTKRPGKYLPRLPTTIASVIALFAASAAVQDMRNTSHLDKKGRSQHLGALDARYGYGSFIGGGDGRVHIGIEKTPFVRVRSKTTWLEKKVTSWRKGSAV